MLAPGAQLPPGTSTRCTVADTSPRSNSPLTPCTHTTCMHHAKWLVLECDICSSCQACLLELLPETHAQERSHGKHSASADSHDEEL